MALKPSPTVHISNVKMCSLVWLKCKSCALRSVLLGEDEGMDPPWPNHGSGSPVSILDHQVQLLTLFMSDLKFCPAFVSLPVEHCSLWMVFRACHLAKQPQCHAVLTAGTTDPSQGSTWIQHPLPSWPDCNRHPRLSSPQRAESLCGANCMKFPLVCILHGIRLPASTKYLNTHSIHVITGSK